MFDDATKQKICQKLSRCFKYVFYDFPDFIFASRRFRHTRAVRVDFDRIEHICDHLIFIIRMFLNPLAGGWLSDNPKLC